MRTLFPVFCLAAIAFAHGGKDKPVFEFPKPEPAKPRQGEKNPDSALLRTVARLAGWPQESARRAAERLIVQKEKSRAIVLDLLVSGDPKAAPLKAGAAYVLGRIGSPDQFLILLHVAVEKRQQKHAAVFLEAAWRLNEKEAVAEAFRFFHLSETTLRREATKFVLNRVTAENLPAVRELLDRRLAERPFTREIGLRLLDRLLTTRQLTWKEAGPVFYRALGDPSPQVASRAMRLLAERNEPENVAALNRLITKKHSFWRQRSYAALALAVLSAAFKEQPFEKASLDILRGPYGLYHSKETLARASAALALAQVGLTTGEKGLVRLLDREIPIVLIDAVGAGRHYYLDFTSVMPLAYMMLRRITGQDLPDQAPAWAQWWRDHARHFHARRELVGVEDIDLPDVVLELTRPRIDGGERTRLTVVGRNPPSFLHGKASALPKEEIKALVAFLKDLGFFRTSELGRPEVDARTAVVVLRVGDLDRTVAFPGDEASMQRRDALIAKMAGLVEQYSWQEWWSAGRQPSWELFYAANLKWFASHKDPSERAARLRSMAVDCLQERVTVDQRLAVVRFVAGLPGGGAALTGKERAAFVAAIKTERDANPFVVEAVNLVTPAPDSETLPGLVDALAELVDPNAQRLLARLLETRGSQNLAEFARDARWKVRRAAVMALDASGGKAARPMLEERLKDDEVLVRVAAAEALARRRDAGVLPVLADLSRSDAPAIRSAAARAYGLLGGAEGIAGAGRMLFSDRNPDVRVSAVDGLVGGGGLEAADLLMQVFARESDIRVRSATARGLVRMESPALVDKVLERLELTPGDDPQRVALVNVLARFRSDRTLVMLRRLLKGDDALSADAAALGLARRWDDSALIQLVQMVRRGDRALLAVRHLQLLTSQEFESESWKRQAENYQGWAVANAGGNPRGWFVRALRERGYDVSAFTAWARVEPGKTEKAVPPPGDKMVPVLLRALRADDWFIQRNACFVLSLRMGPGAPPPISYQTGREEAERTIRIYHDWWEKLQAEREAREKG